MVRHQSQSGFTLIELLVVVIIIAVLAAIGLPAFLGQANRARAAEAELYLGTWLRKQQARYVEQGDFDGEALGTVDAGLKNYTVQVHEFNNHKNVAGVNVSGLRIRAIPTKSGLAQFMGKVWYDAGQEDVETVLCSATGTNTFMQSKTYCPD